MADKDFRVKNRLHVNGLSQTSGVILATNNALDAHTNVPTQYGGTGTTQSPNAGQVLFSSAGTNYVPTTLTSLDVKGATYSADAPASPVVGQVWIESDSSSDSFDPNIIRRKTITATAGQTTFTTDLEFIQGYEQVYFNGMLLLRTSDYTTPSNTSVVLAAAAAAGDIVEILSITNLNSINAATTTTNTFTGSQYIQGAIEATGSISSTTSNAQSVHVDGGGYAYRIRANASNSAGALQFTNNVASTDWAYINASSQNNLVIRTTTGATSPSTYAWLGINGGPVQIRDITAAGGEASDWPVPSLSIASFDDYTHNTMLGFLLRDDDNYILDYSKWNIKVSDTGSKTTSASTTNMHFGGPGAMILYSGNAERMRLAADGTVNVVSGSLQIAGAPVGSVLVSATAVSNSSGATFDGVFSDNRYDNYFIAISNATFSVADVDLTMSLRLSGTGTVAFDNGQYQQQYATTVTSNVSTGGRIGFGSSSYAGLFGAQVTLFNPLVATPTVGFVHGHSINSSGQPFRFTSSIYKYNNASYFGFALTPSSGTFSGIVRVYGLRN